MSENNLYNALRALLEERGQQQPMNALSALYGTAQARTPTWRERGAGLLQDGIEALGADRYRARKIAETVMGGPSSNLPLGMGLVDPTVVGAVFGRQEAPNMGPGAPSGLLANIGPMAKIKPQPLAYQIDHKPMTVAGGASTLDNLLPAFGEDIYSANALQFFGSGDQREKAILRAMHQARGNPDQLVTIWRGVPADAKGINAGDWVTLDARVARDYAQQHPGGRVVSMQVPASHVTAWPDSLLEFGYYPP